MTADITRINTAAEAKLIEQFKAAQAASLDPAGYDRDAAFGHFARAGLPHRRLEAWHYTDLRTVMREAYPAAAVPSAEAIARARAYVEANGLRDAYRAVVVDGHFVPDLTSPGLPGGLRIDSLLDVLGRGDSEAGRRLATGAMEEREAVLALNAAFMQGGVVIDVAAGARLDKPVEVFLIDTGVVSATTTTRSLIRVNDAASIVLLERHANLADLPSQANHVLIVSVGQEAELDHVVLNASGAGLQQVASLLADLDAKSRFSTLALVSGSGFVRRQGFVRFEGAHSRGELRGIALLDHKGHADTTLVVTHKATHCESRELFKHILDDETTGVFQGKVVVAPGAQKTDGKMMSRAIFLNDGANMYNKPELEIFADDVVCGHGATAGYLDESQLFYLRARGIPEKEAQALLLEAFAAEAVEGVGIEDIRALLTESVSRWLRQRQG